MEIVFSEADVKEAFESRKPIELRVEDGGSLVVQEAGAYQKLRDRLEELETIAGIRRGLDSMKRGEGVPLDECFAALGKRSKNELV